MGEVTSMGSYFRRRSIKKAILMSIDSLLIMFAYLCAILFRYYMEGHTISEMMGFLFSFKARLLLSLIILLICQWKTRQYQSIWTLASLEDFALGTISFIIGTIVNLMLSMAIPNRIPFLVTILAGILAMVLCNGVRIAWRMLLRRKYMGEVTSMGSYFRRRSIKKAILMSIDSLLIMFAYLCAILFRYYMEGHTISEMMGFLFSFKARLLLSLIILLICQWKTRQYQSIWTLASLEDFALGTISFIIGTIVNLMLSMAIPNRIPFLVTILAGILAMVLCNGVRIAWRMLRRIIISSQLDQKGQQQRVLIYGAGSAGTLVLNEYRRNPHLGKKVIGFLDDNSEKFETVIGATPVLGERKDLETIINDYQIDEVIIAIAHLDYSILNEVSVKAKRLNVLVKTMPGLFELIDGKFNVGMIRDVSVEELLARDSIQLDYEGISDYLEQVKTMPGLFELIDGKFNVGMIRDVSVEELLARDSIQLDYEGISDYLEHQVVMVTGGGGSIGSELCRQIAKFHPTQLIIVDIYENNAYDLQNELRRQYPQLNLVTLIASVRERDRLKEIYETYRPDVVFHAAAHKHVPLMEDSPAEAIKNNVVGTLHTAELASEYGKIMHMIYKMNCAVSIRN